MTMSDGAFQQPQNFGVDSAPAAYQAPSLTCDGTPAVAAMAAIKNADAAFQRHLLTTPSDGSLSAIGVRNYIQSFTATPAFKAIDPALNAVTDAADAADANVDAVRSQLADVGDDAAAQTAALRYWTRMSFLFNSIKDPAHLHDKIDDVVTNAMPDQLAVLLEELPTFLAARRAPSDLASKGTSNTAWFDDLAAKRVPAIADATAAASSASKARDIVTYAAKAVKQRIAETAGPFGYHSPHLDSLHASNSLIGQ
ncbi:hypothetical protein ACTXG7_02330 [Mycolicibacterium sp. Dal123E01]|uniref:hypothetical protein n=1 Tax=Mycolicibacterium sp. Dal123E01 TaxID=3457578 RepID=UPI00403EB1D9